MAKGDDNSTRALMRMGLNTPMGNQGQFGGQRMPFNRGLPSGSRGPMNPLQQSAMNMAPAFANRAMAGGGMPSMDPSMIQKLIMQALMGNQMAGSNPALGAGNIGTAMDRNQFGGGMGGGGNLGTALDRNQVGFMPGETVGDDRNNPAFIAEPPTMGPSTDMMRRRGFFGGRMNRNLYG